MPIKRIPGISPKAVARVKDRVPIPRTCDHCGQRVAIMTHEEIYGQDYSDWPYVYSCTGCQARVGIHPQTDIPLGTLADLELRQMRTKGKMRWKEQCAKRGFTRTQSYMWLAALLDCPKSEAHWGWMDKAQCKLVIDTMEALDATAQ